MAVAPASIPDTQPDIDLEHLLQIVQRRRWIVVAVFFITVLSSAMFVFTARPVYTATALLLIEKEVSRAYNEGNRVEQAADDYYQTQYKLLKSRTLLRKVHAALSLDDTEDFAGSIDRLGGAVQIQPIPRSRLVNIRVDSHDPDLAARAANRLAELYVADNLENKLFISKEILRMLRPEKDAGLSRRAYESLPAVVNNPLILNLRQTHSGLEVRWGELSARYTPEHPLRARLKAEMDAVRAQLHQETDRIVEGMRVELSGQLLGNNVRVVDAAEAPGSPSKPNKNRTLAIATLAGLLLGCLAALAVEALDQSLRSQEDIEKKLGLPFLGAVTKADIPGSDSAEQLRQLLTQPDSLTGEALRNIRTMIGFAAAGSDMRRILITSTSQGEGKTFIATNLALVFAQMGERVLVIEGDLRYPNLHKRFRLPNEIGLSHFLAHGKDISEVAALVQPGPGENLHILPCGPIPPNPAELLSTPKVGALLRWAHERYDRVLVDGTPVFPITDALLWASHVDAAVFVVKFGSVHATFAVRARKKIQESGLKIAGVVVNQVTWQSDSYYGYGYHYAYQSRYLKPDGHRPRKAEKAEKA